MEGSDDFDAMLDYLEEDAEQCDADNIIYSGNLDIELFPQKPSAANKDAAKAPSAAAAKPPAQGKVIKERQIDRDSGGEREQGKVRMARESKGCLPLWRTAARGEIRACAYACACACACVHESRVKDVWRYFD